MTFSTAAVAVCCSRASLNSRVRVSTCFWRSAPDTCAVGALRAWGLIRALPLYRLSTSTASLHVAPFGGSRRCSILCKSQLSRHGMTGG